MWKTPVQKHKKLIPWTPITKSRSFEFLSEAGTNQKIIPDGKKTTALTDFPVRNPHKDFWLSKLRGRINLETFQKFEGKGSCGRTSKSVISKLV